MDSVHELIVVNVVVLWLAVGATALVLLRRRAGGREWDRGGPNTTWFREENRRNAR